MDLNVRDLSETVVELTVELPAQDVQKELDHDYGELQKKIELPGFRKGKVPRSVVKKRFGREVESEVLQELGAKMLEDALAQSKLRPVGDPSVESIQLKEGEP